MSTRCRTRLALLTPTMLLSLAAFGEEASTPDATPPARTALEVKATQPKMFYVDTVAGRNQVAISSESTLEDFTIVCNRIDGAWKFDPRHVEALTGRFAIRVEDLRSGIELRDRHLRDADWLDAAKSPEIVIVVSRAEAVKKTAPNAVNLVLVGRLSLHGVTRDIRVPLNLTYLDESPRTMQRLKGDLIRLRTGFEVSLADYQIRGPAGSNVIGLKVADRLPIKVSVFGSTEKPPPTLKADNLGATTQPDSATSRPAPAVNPGGVLTPPSMPAP